MLTLFLSLVAQTTAPAAAIAPLTEVHRRDMRCAAAFAIIASEQQRNVASALNYPPLGKRGQQYFADTGERIIGETGMTKEQVRGELENIVKSLQSEAIESDDPETVAQAIMTPCLKLLDAAIPPEDPPTIIECAAVLQIAYEEVYAREGLSKTAQDLKTLASVLESRARDEMRAAGYSGNEADAELVLTREEILAQAIAIETTGESSSFDYGHCFELAAP